MVAVDWDSCIADGAIKSRMAKKNWVRGGIEMAVLGTGIALVGYGIGSELNKVGIVNVQGGGNSPVQ
jgi:hypothetical protein